MVVSFPASKDRNKSKETKCDIFCTLVSTLKLVNIPKPVRYEVYTLAFPFDLR